MTCISCSHIHNEKYCPNCGEYSGTKKITINSIIEGAFSTVTNMDKGFLFNLKALFLDPRIIIDQFVKGKRKGILNPISYLIISITIYLIVITVFKEAPKELADTNIEVKSAGEKIGNAIGYFIRKYIKYFWILSVIPLGLSLRIIYKKYNFLEHVAVSSFVIGHATLIGVISHLIFKFPLILDPIVYIAITWMIYRVFKYERSSIESVLLAIVALLLFIIQLVVIIVALTFIII
ncbi:DUF3667 domain-containing protein [Winogradskyella ursingii]|uniref:DUF3667 domain-containing protein n=1 Tax=Winogradskyella ursingii TaxID=2686079 RepID=UPI0015C97FFF|nr:DUF3667 domain-containing protein [Winogradskyella ursingii]